MHSPKLGAEYRGSDTPATERDRYAFAGAMYGECRTMYTNDLEAWHRQKQGVRGPLPEWKTLRWLDDIYGPVRQRLKPLRFEF